MPAVSDHSDTRGSLAQPCSLSIKGIYTSPSLSRGSPVTEEQISAIRARLRFNSIDEFIDGYARYISPGGIFIPMAEKKLKPLGTTVRFQFLLHDDTTALLGEGVVHQLHPPDPNAPGSPVGILVKFTKLSQSSKQIVERIGAMKELSSQPQNQMTAYGLPGAPFMEESTGLDEPTAHAQDDLIAQTMQQAAEPTSAIGSNIHNADTPLPPQAQLSSPFDAAADIDPATSPTPTLSEDDGVPGLFDDELNAQDHGSDAIDDDFFDLAQSYAGEKKPEQDGPPSNFNLDESFDLGFDDGLLEKSLSSFSFGQDDPESKSNPFVHEAPTNGGAKALEPSLLERSEASFEQRRIAQTQGGLQVVAYHQDTNIEDEARGLAELSLNDDDAEIDEAFDNIFGGGGDTDGFGSGFDRMFSSPSISPISSSTQPGPEPEPEPEGLAPSAELENLLGSLEDDDDNEDLTSFSLNTGLESKDVEEKEDDSLDDLLALARKDMEEQRSQSDAQPNTKDLLEQLLGDDVNLPPPNANADSVFAMPAPKLQQAPEEEPEVVEEPEQEEDEKEEKKGFFSSLFRRKND